MKTSLGQTARETRFAQACLRVETPSLISRKSGYRRSAATGIRTELQFTVVYFSFRRKSKLRF